MFQRKFNIWLEKRLREQNNENPQINKLDMNLPVLDVDISVPCPNDNGGHNGHGPGRRHTPLGGRGRGGLAPSRGRGWYGGRGGSLSTLTRQVHYYT